MNHTYYKCPPGCDKPHCSYCQGGLASCTICGGGEGSLPTECPGVMMTAQTQDDVYNGLIDYRDGKWTDEPKIKVTR